MRRLCFVALFLTLGATPAWAAGLKVKTEKVPPPAELKEAVKAQLSDEAVQVTDEKGGAYLTIWFRKEIPSKATAQQVKNGLTYREVQQSTLVGAVQLPQKWIDFRKQEIPKGVYTLRLGIQPMDGDHMGTAPYNEFCLLCPAANDKKPDPMDVKAMQTLSAMSHGATHPAVMLLFPNPKPEDQPKLVDKGNDIVVVNVKRPVAAGGEKTSLGFGLTVAGHTAE